MVCGLLLLASAINYMDRQTLANAAVRITREFGLTQEQYGNLEAVFGYAFAAGSLVFGLLADRVSLRWLYAVVLALWSVAGFATGFVRELRRAAALPDAAGLLRGRALAVRHPDHARCCSMRATLAGQQRAAKRHVDRRDHHAADHARADDRGTREAGACRFRSSAPWASSGSCCGLLLVRETIFGRAAAPIAAGVDARRRQFLAVIFSRRMLVIFFVIACINTTWQILRAWLPKILRKAAATRKTHALYFNSAWFAATDVGCLGAGALAVWLARRQLSVHAARLLVFRRAALLCASCALAPWLGTAGCCSRC